MFNQIVLCQKRSVTKTLFNYASIVCNNVLLLLLFYNYEVRQLQPINSFIYLILWLILCFNNKAKIRRFHVPFVNFCREFWRGYRRQLSPPLSTIPLMISKCKSPPGDQSLNIVLRIPQYFPAGYRACINANAVIFLVEQTKHMV